MYQHLKKIYLGKYGQNILCTPLKLPAPTRETSVISGGGECINRAVLSKELFVCTDRLNIKGYVHTNCNMSHVSTLQIDR